MIGRQPLEAATFDRFGAPVGDRPRSAPLSRSVAFQSTMPDRSAAKCAVSVRAASCNPPFRCVAP
jgi:hypothetical protein